MEKERKTRIIAIVALCIAVIGLSIGFAAFTRNLNITFSDSNVNISGDLDVRILASNNPNDTSTIINGEAVVGENIIVNPATITSNGTAISGVGFTFSDNGQGVMYEFYVHNNSEYDAYLKSVEFLNYMGHETNKVCTALEGTTQSMVNDACDAIVIGLAADFDGDNGISDGEALYDTIGNISQVKIPKDGIILGTLLIAYIGDSTSAILPNGDFKVNFGDIKLNFSSLEG